MSQFEFETKEQREAWRVIRERYVLSFNISHYTDAGSVGRMFDLAASRFDACEATCGIEPLSEEHARLIIANGNYASQQKLVSKDLLRESMGTYYITDRGREVLANLNAMCKAEK